MGEHVAFWIDVATRKETRAGDYQSTVTVTAEGCEPIKVQLDIRVWNITLPDGTHLGNAFTYDEPSTARLYKDRWSRDLAYKYYDFILDHRLNIDALYGHRVRNAEMIAYGAKRGMKAFNLFCVYKGSDPKEIKKLIGIIDKTTHYGGLG